MGMFGVASQLKRVFLVIEQPKNKEINYIHSRYAVYTNNTMI